jgi:hypothetical protein
MVDPLRIIDQYFGEIPVPIFDIIEEFGIAFERRTVSENISGWIEKISGQNYKIVVNLTHAETRQRFTAAHELGHYIYHRNLLGKGVGDTRAYRAETTPFPNSAIQPVHERQANSFAANVLMPRWAIDKLKDEGYKKPTLLASKLFVSEPAMRIRLGLSAYPDTNKTVPTTQKDTDFRNGGMTSEGFIFPEIGYETIVKLWETEIDPTPDADFIEVENLAKED